MAQNHTGRSVRFLVGPLTGRCGEVLGWNPDESTQLLVKLPQEAGGRVIKLGVAKLGTLAELEDTDDRPPASVPLARSWSRAADPILRVTAAKRAARHWRGRASAPPSEPTLERQLSDKGKALLREALGGGGPRTAPPETTKKPKKPKGRYASLMANMVSEHDDGGEKGQGQGPTGLGGGQFSKLDRI